MFVLLIYSSYEGAVSSRSDTACNGMVIANGEWGLNFDGQSGTWTGFSPSTSVSPSQYHSTSAPYSVHLPPSLYHLSSWQSWNKALPPHSCLSLCFNGSSRGLFKILLSPFCTSLCSLKCYINQQTQPYTSNVLGLYSALHASAAYISHNQVSIGSQKKKNEKRERPLLAKWCKIATKLAYVVC